MAYQMNLLPEASIDLDGFCVPVQMQICSAKRSAPGAAGQQNSTRRLQPTHTIDEMKDFMEQIRERVHGPRPGAAPTVHRQPTAMEHARLAKFVPAWEHFTPWGKWVELDWLKEQSSRNSNLRRVFNTPPSFADELRIVYGKLCPARRYARFFEAFFEARTVRTVHLGAEDETGIQVRRRVPPGSQYHAMQ